VSQPPKRVCAICGAPAPPVFRAPAPEIAPDLDLRPGEPARSTMERWLQSCRRCGAAAPDLAALPPAARDALAGGWDRSEPAALRWATLAAALGDTRAQAEALLQAAWAEDDAGNDASAAELRRHVASLWGEAADTETALRRLDVLRRSGTFADAAAWAGTLAGRPMDDVGAAILRFQTGRIAANDRARYLISAALPPPAHAPHITHVQKPQPTLFARLFSRTARR